jgi:hypothetical protein
MSPKTFLIAHHNLSKTSYFGQTITDSAHLSVKTTVKNSPTISPIEKRQKINLWQTPYYGARTYACTSESPYFKPNIANLKKLTPQNRPKSSKNRSYLLLF